MNWKPCGPHAALFQLPDSDGDALIARARGIQRFLESAGDVGDFSIAFDKVLIEARNGDLLDADYWAHALAEVAPIGDADARLHEVPVRYEGPDLAEVAVHAGMDVAEVIERHAAPTYDVALLGFSPGFPYLEGLDARLEIPRRANPRPRVPAGAVAIGGRHAGIYSVASPGGWHLLGATDVRLFDPARRHADDETAMFLLRAGDRVRFLPED